MVDPPHHVRANDPTTTRLPCAARVLSPMLDENEFLSPYGLRSLSLYHRDSPYVFEVDDGTWFPSGLEFA